MYFREIAIKNQYGDLRLVDNINQDYRQNTYYIYYYLDGERVLWKGTSKLLHDRIYNEIKELIESGASFIDINEVEKQIEKDEQKHTKEEEKFMVGDFIKISDEIYIICRINGDANHCQLTHVSSNSQGCYWGDRIRITSRSELSRAFVSISDLKNAASPFDLKKVKVEIKEID